MSIIARFLAFSLFLTLYASQLGAADDPAPMQASNHPQQLDHLRQLQGRAFDIEFMKHMISHHAGAIELADLAKDSATHPEIREFSVAVIEKQKKENEQMEKMLNALGEKSSKPDAGMKHQAKDAKAIMQTQPAEERDKVFLAKMTEHHQQGVEAARLAVERSSDANLKEMAQMMVDDQTKEIQRMAKWHHDWYGTDLPKPGHETPTGNKDDDHKPDHKQH